MRVQRLQLDWFLEVGGREPEREKPDLALPRRQFSVEITRAWAETAHADLQALLRSLRPLVVVAERLAANIEARERIWRAPTRSDHGATSGVTGTRP